MRYYFVIDTDTHAGNFEREVCAFVTGMTGDCGKGESIAKKIRNQIGSNIPDDLIGEEPDEYGCHRPVKIYPTPGYYNNGLGFEYKIGEEDLAKEAYKKYCLNEAREETDEETKQDWLERANNELVQWPSYQSVAIVLSKRPDDKVIKFMKDRAEALAFASRNNKTVDLCGIKICKFTISGFRFVTERIVAAEEDL